MIRKSIHKCLQSVNSVNQRILTATFHGNPKLTVTVAYTLKDHLEKVKKHNKRLVVGDFNARIGQDSHTLLPAVIGPHCVYDTTNDNGERLVNICQDHKLRPAQSRFPQPRKLLIS